MYLARCDLDTAEALDDDVVSVVADDDHGEDGDRSEDAPDTRVDLASLTHPCDQVRTQGVKEVSD